MRRLQINQHHSADGAAWSHRNYDAWSGAQHGCAGLASLWCVPRVAQYAGRAPHTVISSLDNHRPTTSWSFYLLLFGVAFSPYYIIAHELFGQPTLFGKALFLAALTTIMIGLFIYHASYLFRRLGGWMLLLVWLSATIILSLRSIVYGVGLEFFTYRFAFLVFVYGCVALPFVRSAECARILGRVLLWSCIVQAVLGIIHSIYFPYIVTGITLDDSGQAIYVLDAGAGGGYRENGTLITANMYGAFLVFGLILLFVKTPRLTRRSLLRVAPLAGLLWWGIALSGSRYALGGAALVTGYFLIKSTPSYVFTLALPVAVALFAASPAVARVQQRFATEGSGGRVAIASTAVDLATKRVSSLMLGVPSAEEAATRTAGDQILSDNSYASMVLDYGLPFTLLLLFYLGLVWSSIVRLKGWVLVTVLFIAGQFAITNALYWDPFLIFAGATVLVVDAMRRDSSRPRRSEPLPISILE